MSNVVGTSINFERKGYGRGLILGLTMAETMLLLVFCLLLAAGAIIANEQREADAAVEAKAKAEDRAFDAEAELVRLLEGATGRTFSDEELRELVSAKKATDAFKEAGLTVEEAVKLVPAAAVLRDHGITDETARELVPAVKALKEKGLGAQEIEAMSESIAVLRDNGYGNPDKTARQLSEALKKAEADQNAKPHKWPPIISLSELGGYNFKVGSAELSDSFMAKLREKAGEVAGTAKEYSVDIIEVIGHTDEQNMAEDFSNMDSGLKAVLDGVKPIGSLHPSDNAGLGLARAISVAEFLEKLPELRGFTILPMSGGQLILPGDRLTDGAQSGDVKARRRIEIRVRQRSTTQKEVDPPSFHSPR